MDVVVFGAGLNATRSINFLKQKKLDAILASMK